MKQRLGLACALVGEPAYLLMDEPTTALDPDGRSWIEALLLNRAAAGCAIVISTHDFTMVERIADRVLTLSNGQIVSDRPVQRNR